jgi:ATP-dependent DNA helicase RecG
MFTQMGRAEEIGSGVVNVNRYLKHYIAGAKKPLFLDGVVFKTTVPLGEHLLVDVEKQSGEKAENGGVNDFAGMSAGVKTVYELIKNIPKVRQPMIAEKTGIPLKTVEKKISWLKKNNMIVFVGPPKTGGYSIIADLPDGGVNGGVNG